ncbi:MAG: molybdopterin-dependent oxidoreductase [Chloroflexi bacterium]|nr:molybdopterin-dependent oxidoreductase [Chloroflexota bacterium]
MSDRKIIKSSCKSCHGSCGVLVTVENGQIVRIEGNPDSPTRGTMCSKGQASFQEVNNPNRLKYPLKRIGQRGEGKWERITWDEALDTIGGKINEARAQYGANSIVISQGTGRGYSSFTVRLTGSIGTGNLMGPLHVCYMPRLMIFALVVGGRLYCDFHGWGGKKPKTIISWAKQMETNNIDGEMGVWLLDALEETKNLIQVDPRTTRLSGRATQWLRVRPGTDAALALGMTNVIINEGLYDREFVANWTFGFDKLRERVQDFPPDRVAEITWVPKEKIIWAARTFATDRPGVIMIGEPLEAANNCTSTIHALVNLCAITGNIESPGSMMVWQGPRDINIEEFGREVRLTEENRKAIIGGDKHKFSQLARVAQPETVFRQLKEERSNVQVMHIHGSNPLLCYANTRDTLAGLMKVPFLSVADLYMSPTAEYADIVLPVAHWLEMDAIWDEIAVFYIGAINKVVEPPGDAWPDNKIFNELGKRVAPEHWFDTVEDLLNYQLRKGKITWKEFKELGFLARTGKDQTYYKYKTDFWRKGGGFKTKTGKIELYSTALEDFGYDPLPYYKEPNESPYSTPELAKEYPFILSTGGRMPYYFHSQYRQLPWLRERQPYPIVQIHPGTAAGLGIKEGDWVWIETPRGRIKQKAELLPTLDPRVVVAQSHWWYPEKPGPDHGLSETCANMLTDNKLPFDPPTGASSLRALLCKIYRADEQ